MMSLRRISAVLALLGSVLVAAPWGFAADIRGTPHNLTRAREAVNAEEVCVFCHTPQIPVGPSLERSSGVAQPAWQPSLPGNHAFVMYDDIGRLQFGDKVAVGSQSIACLSCHDANQAFSVMAADSDHPFGIPYQGSRTFRAEFGGFSP